MSRDDFVKWMELNDLSEHIIASVLDMDVRTIKGFLSGAPVHRSTKLALTKLVADPSAYRLDLTGGRKIATG